MASPSSDHGTYVSQNFPELIGFLLPGIRPLSMEPSRFSLSAGTMLARDAAK